MDVGVPKEVRDFEHRVGLTPAGVFALTKRGHRVYVESEAGGSAGFSDEDYRQLGATILYSADEVFGRSQLIAKVSRLTASEYSHLRAGMTMLSFLHFAVASPDLAETMADKKMNAFAYEMIRDEKGRLPVLFPTSQVAGRLAPIIAGRLLENSYGGRGILLSGIPGVPPAAVVIIGAGVLGLNATRAFRGLGAQVTVLDKDHARLELADRTFSGGVTTLLSSQYNLGRVLKFADVVVGAVLVPGERTPVLLTREMIRNMRPLAVFLDFSIDQGGCAETSRPTSHQYPTYVEEGVIHFAVPNVPARVARTASYALTNAALPYLIQICELGLDGALRESPGLQLGLKVRQGIIQPS